MKKIKCPECQNLVDENLKECSCCGYTFDGTEESFEPEEDEHSKKEFEVATEEGGKEEEENLKLENDNKEEENPEKQEEAINVEDEKNSEVKKIFDKKKIILLVSIIGICILGFVIYKTSDLGRYNSAQNAYKNKQYAEAMQIFKNLGKYKDSNKMYEKAKHMDAVSKDKTQPSFKNLPEKIEVTMGETFDGEKWCEENSISVIDDVTTNVKYNVDDSQIDVTREGTYNFILSAKDEAGNKKEEIIEIVVKREYTQEEISNAVKSTYIKPIPGLQGIEYRKDSESVWVYVMHDGMANAAVGAINHSIVKYNWDGLTKKFDELSQQIYSHLLSEGYDDIESVCFTLLNDTDPESVLYATANGIIIFDATEK